MSYHMPQVDTPALNPLVVFIKYSCTGVSTFVPEDVCLEFTSEIKKYNPFAKERYAETKC